MRPADTDPIERPEGSDYFEVIEDTFVARRGKHLFLSPADWHLMEEWKERGIPVSVALRAINEVFDKRAVPGRSPTLRQTSAINSLRYCAPAVEDAYRQYLASRVGSHDGDGQASAPADPFSRKAVLAHLERTREALLKVHRIHGTKECGPLCEAALSAQAALAILESTVLANELSSRVVEVRLAEIESNLDSSIRTCAAPEQLSEAGEAVTGQLAPYRSKMNGEAYDQTFERLLMKRLRESCGIPRLSLFFA